MAYLDYPGLAYFKSLLDQTYFRINYDGDTIIAGNVTFTNPIIGDIDGRAKKDWLGQQFDTTYLKDIQPDESGALKLILGNGQVSHLVTDTTVTQERSSANETYPVLLCYDENATANQIAKKVKYGHDVQINPAYGYIYAQGYTEKHPAYNRTAAQSSRVEWMLDFRDSVLNPVGQIYSYVDPSSQGGEHRMEFRLYGNPHTTSLNLPNYNFETDTVSLGISSTKGDKLTFFGYAPSTPIYLENGTTMRKSTIRGDQYGRDIITRDWLNLNGSITGLVHTYMDETIDGYKTFLKTVTIDSSNDNAKAGLNVQGDVNIDSGDASKPSNLYVQGNSHIHGNEDIDGNLNVDGTSTLDGNVHMKHNLDVDGNLNVDGTSDQHGNVHMYNNLDVDGNANTDGNQTIGGTLTVTGNETVGGTLTVTGKITGNGGAEISGGNGLKVTGNETVTGKLTAEDLEATDDLIVGDTATIGGTILKKTGTSTTQEYVSYITNQESSRTTIINNMADTYTIKNNNSKLSVDLTSARAADLAKITAALIQTGGGLVVDPTTKKLKVTFEDPDPAFIQGVVEGMIDKDSSGNFVGGLSTNPTTGKLIVDFSQIDEDTKNEILKGLSMQIPLTRNIYLFVDKNHANAADTLDDDRGTENKPFKTIQACINYLTQTYAFGTHAGVIQVKEGVYEENLVLPEFTRSSGYIILKSYSENKNVTVFSRNGASTIACSGGKWYVRFLHLKHECRRVLTSTNGVEVCVTAQNGSTLNLGGNKYEIIFPSDFDNSNNYYHDVRVINPDGNSSIAIETQKVSSEFIVEPHQGSRLTVFAVMRSGNLFLHSYAGDDTSIVTDYPCSGGVSYFAEVSSNGSISTVSSGRAPHFIASEEFTGKRYQCTTGGTILVQGNDDGEYFPGSIAGTVQESTYCWYQD